MNLADVMYFQYTFKRATGDALDLLVLGGDFIRLLPQFLYDFWYLVLSWVALMWFSNKLYTRFGNPPQEKTSGVKMQLLWLVGIVLMSIIAGRGGLQLKPIGIITAGFNTSPQNIPLVLNTPFTVLTTLGKEELEEVSFFKQDELAAVYSPVHQYSAAPDSVKALNVVVLIMESFSSEYSAVFGNRSNTFTPTLDSLSGNGMVFLRCFANGRKSIEGIPAITAGLPNLMDEPYITSIFAGNNVQSIAGNLAGNGYSSSFYHGGANGTMGFDAFAIVSGYQRYEGRKEYDNDAYFDGKWGIFDEEYFQYFKEGLDQQQQPFSSCFVSLSSHNPYIIPKRYDSVFKAGPLPIHQSIQYADYAMGQFFEAAAQTDWFDNTLFVITADHCAQAEDNYYKNRVGMYSVPLLFYHPKGGLKGVSNRVTQQIDILPSVMDYLGYGSAFVGFGNSVFEEENGGFAINYLNGLHQLIQADYVLQFNGVETVGLYNYEVDKNLSNNLARSESEVTVPMEKLLKGIIQSYNYRLIHNQLTVTKGS